MLVKLIPAAEPDIVVPASRKTPPASDFSQIEFPAVPWSEWILIVSDVPPSAVNKIALAPLRPDLILIPPT